MSRKRQRVLLFGEAQKGACCTPLELNNLEHLFETLGTPPKDTFGVDYAIQTLLCKRDLIFYRVREEGFSLEDYFKGIRLLSKEGKKMGISAICMPGMGDPSVLEKVAPICKSLNVLFLVSERDFYDYSTGSKY